MPIELLTSGQNFVEDFKNKINEICEKYNRLEKAKIVPGGINKLPDMIDLGSAFLTRDEARQAGLPIP